MDLTMTVRPTDKDYDDYVYDDNYNLRWIELYYQDSTWN